MGRSMELIVILKTVIRNKILRPKSGGVNWNSPLLHVTSAFLNGVSEHRHRFLVKVQSARSLMRFHDGILHCFRGFASSKWNLQLSGRKRTALFWIARCVHWISNQFLFHQPSRQADLPTQPYLKNWQIKLYLLNR